MRQHAHDTHRPKRPASAFYFAHGERRKIMCLRNRSGGVDVKSEGSLGRCGSALIASALCTQQLRATPLCARQDITHKRAHSTSTPHLPFEKQFIIPPGRKTEINPNTSTAFTFSLTPEKNLRHLIRSTLTTARKGVTCMRGENWWGCTHDVPELKKRFSKYIC